MLLSTIFFFTCATAKIILIHPCDEMRQAFLPSLASYYERTRTRVGTHEDGATRGSQSLSRCAGGETSLVLDIQGAKDGLDGLLLS